MFFFKNDFIYECTSYELNIFMHHNMLDYLLHPTNFNDWKCSTDKSRGVFRILILRVLSVNRIFPLRVLTAGAISLFLNITGAIAPVAPVLNTPLASYFKQMIEGMNIYEKQCSTLSLTCGDFFPTVYIIVKF